MMKSLIAATAMVAVAVPNAFAVAPMAIEEKVASPEYIAPVETPVSFDESLINHTSSALFEVKCKKDEILSAIGIKSDKKITTVGFEQDGLNFNIDVTNCNIGVYPTTWNQGNAKGISKDAALAKAKEAIKLVSGLTLPVKDGIVLATNNYGPIYYAKTMDSGMVSAEPVQVEEDDNSNVSIENLYQSVSVLFPFDLGKGTTYSNSYSGNPEGITVTIDGNGNVSGINGQAKFSLIKRTSEKASIADVIATIKKRPMYYGVAASPKVDVKRGLVLFNYMSNGVNKQYLSTGYSVKPANADMTQYGFSVSDYTIGNQ